MRGQINPVPTNKESESKYTLIYYNVHAVGDKPVLLG